MSGGKKGVALAGGVSLLLGSSVGALTVWLAKRVMGDRGTGSAGCPLHVLCVGRIPGMGQGRPPCRRCRQRTTPAMAAGVADHVWSLTEIVALPDSNDDSNSPTTRRPASKTLGPEMVWTDALAVVSSAGVAPTSYFCFGQWRQP